MTTRAVLEQRALRIVGVIDAFNGPNSTLAAEAADVLTALHEQWVDERLVTWELSNIPTKADKALVDLLAYDLTNYHPVSPIRKSEITAEAIRARRTLEQQYEIPHDGEPLRPEYF